MFRARCAPKGEAPWSLLPECNRSDVIARKRRSGSRSHAWDGVARAAGPETAGTSGVAILRSFHFHCIRHVAANFCAGHLGGPGRLPGEEPSGAVYHKLRVNGECISITHVVKVLGFYRQQRWRRGQLVPPPAARNLLPCWAPPLHTSPLSAPFTHPQDIMANTLLAAGASPAMVSLLLSAPAATRAPTCRISLCAGLLGVCPGQPAAHNKRPAAPP